MIRVDAGEARARMLKRARTVLSAGRTSVEQAAANAAVSAQKTTAFANRTGETRASVRAAIGFGFSAAVRAGGAAVFLESGTRRHPIVASGRALRFSISGQTVFRKRVMHPGTRATHFLSNAARGVAFNRIAAIELARAIR